MIANVIGATGAVGRDLITQLAADESFTEVHLFVRREIPSPGEKFQIHVINFDKPEEWKHLVTGDVLFSCLGTSKKQAGSKQAQWHVDHDYQIAFAKAAKENGVPSFIIVSSIGAKKTSAAFYLKMKGQIDEEVTKMAFPRAFILRPPSLIRHPAKRFTETLSVKVLQFFNKLRMFRRFRPMPTMDVARAMIHFAKNQARRGTIIVNDQEILTAK